MTAFEQKIKKLFGKDYKKVTAAKIGIAGLGGLGSNCAFNLARTGFKNFVLADFDKVSVSNLNRQFYFQNQVGQFKTRALKANLLKINPAIKTKLHNAVINENNLDVFEDCGIIVEAFDDAESKSMLCENFIGTGKFLVAASGIAGFGNLNEIKIKKIKNNFYVVGDFKTGVSKKVPPLSPRVNIAAAMQADIILGYVLEKRS